MHFTQQQAASNPISASTSSAPQSVCQNCATSTTPLWRRAEDGTVLCNACGLFLKLHGRPRPISLKTDVIKSRNRIKVAGSDGKKKKKGDPFEQQHASLPAAYPSTERANQQHPPSAFSDCPVSRTSTPSLSGHPPNIAPQHLFDAIVQIPGTASTNDSLVNPHPKPQFPHRAPSPGAVSTSSLNAGEGAYPNQISGSNLEPPHSQYSESTALKTRVSELEVINDLFRGRVAELEASEQEARKQEMLARDAQRKAIMNLEYAHRRLEAVQSELDGYIGEEKRNGKERRKRLRVENFVRDVDASREAATLSQAT